VKYFYVIASAIFKIFADPDFTGDLVYTGAGFV
jgi:hypothetical protein